MSRPIRTDATDVQHYIRALGASGNANPGDPIEGVTAATSGIALWYRKAGGAKTAISLSNLSALTDAHSDGGILAIDDGWLRLDLPDAAVPDATGDETIVGGAATDIIFVSQPLVGVTDLTAAEVNAEADTALTDYDPPTRAELTSDIAGLNDPTAAAIADAVWVEAIADHSGTSGSTAEALDGATAPTAAQIWSYSPRTLTQSAASVAAAVSGSDVTVYQGATWTIPLTGLGSIATRTMLWFSVKQVTNDADTDSAVMIEETAGLQYLAGAAAGTSSDGSITVDDENAGDITITLKPASSDDVPDSATYQYGVKVLTSAGVITQLTEGRLTVKPSLPLAVS